MTSPERLIEYMANHPDKEGGFKSARNYGVDPQDISPMLYKIVSDMIQHAGNPESLKELRQGIKVEMEHTSYPCVAALIASAHLSERTDYYSAMKEAGID